MHAQGGNGGSGEIQRIGMGGGSGEIQRIGMGGGSGEIQRLGMGGGSGEIQRIGVVVVHYLGTGPKTLLVLLAKALEFLLVV